MKTAKALPVLMYHHVSPSPGLVTVSPETFRAHMSWLASRGYTTVTCDQLMGFLAGKPLPKRSVLITFDDGYLDNFVHAHPILAELGLHAAIFLVTGWVGDGPARAHAGTDKEVPFCPDHKTCMARIREGQADDVMLRWSEIDVMRQNGTWEFHSHTHSHTRWDKTLVDPAQRRTALSEDLARSRDTLKQRLGLETPHLCWPQGYFDDDYVAVATEAGFRVLYTTRRHVNTRHTSALDIGRVVTKDRKDGWLGQRLFIYSRPLLGRIYNVLRGER